jgi:hypothetical protein
MIGRTACIGIFFEAHHRGFIVRLARYRMYQPIASAGYRKVHHNHYVHLHLRIPRFSSVCCTLPHTQP